MESEKLINDFLKFWKLDTVNWSLVYQSTNGRGEGYNVPLAQCRSSAMVLDQLAQFSRKQFATRESAGELLWALDDALDLEGNYCGDGVDQDEKTESEVRELVDRKWS